MSATKEELAATQREVATMRADLRDVHDRQAAAAEMHSKEEMAAKDAQIAELSVVCIYSNHFSTARVLLAASP